MNFRKIIYNRKNKPHYKHLGNITQSSIDFLISNFNTVPESLDVARDLRDDYSVDKERNDYDQFLDNYRQYDIQYRLENDDNVESSYKHYYPKFSQIYDELSCILSSKVYRLRYAKILKDDELGYHIDQPDLDRFVMVVDGEHIAEIDTDKEVFQQVMKPGEVWYMNTSWKHRVVNSGNKERIALLGCFNYSF